MTEEKIYKLPEAVVQKYDEETRQQTRLVGIALVIGGGVVTAVIAAFGLFPWSTLIFVVPGWLLFVAVGMFLHGQTQRENWSSFSIEIGEDRVRQLRAGRKTVVIKRDQITSVEEIPDTGLLIKTERTLRVILVPDAIDGYEMIKAAINNWFTESE